MSSVQQAQMSKPPTPSKVAMFSKNRVFSARGTHATPRTPTKGATPRTSNKDATPRTPNIDASPQTPEPIVLSASRAHGQMMKAAEKQTTAEEANGESAAASAPVSPSPSPCQSPAPDAQPPMEAGVNESRKMSTFSELPVSEHRPITAVSSVLGVAVGISFLSKWYEKKVASMDAVTGLDAGISAKLEPINQTNTLFMLMSGAMVMLITPALSLYYGGLVRDGAVLNRMVRTFVCLGIVGAQWLCVGYSLCFAPSNPYAFYLVGDFSFAALQHVDWSTANLPHNLKGFDVSHLAYASYQLMFASITTTILSGAIAEYMSFRSFCLFIMLWTTFVYDPICHAIWGGGLMSWHLDFAGGTAIHLLSGISAVAAATYLRYISRSDSTLTAAKETDEALDPTEPTSVYETRKIERRESFDKELANLYAGTATEHSSDWDRAMGGPTIAHNSSFVALGTTLIWFGWFGFNGGSALAPNDVAAIAIANTNFAAAFGMIAWLLHEYTSGGNPSTVGAATGAICGLVTITPCAGYVPLLCSPPIGMLGATIAFRFAWLDEAFSYLKNRSIENQLDVFGIHGVCGLVGSLITPIFASKAINIGDEKLEDGLLFGGGVLPFVKSASAVLITSLYAVIMTPLLLWIIKAMLGVQGLLSAQLFFSEHIKSKASKPIKPRLDA